MLRPYRSRSDLDAIGTLIRRAWAVAPRFNAWTFPRFDIWAQWRIADEELHGRSAWHDDIALWEDGDDVVAAASGGDDDGDMALVLAPRSLALVPQLLRFAEGRRAGVVVEANESSAWVCDALAREGYKPGGDGWYIPREKTLLHRNAVVMPPGFRLDTLRPDDAERYLDASNAVFGHGLAVDAYRYLAGARSAAPGVGVIALDEDGGVAAFANAWVDRGLGVAELEPVGTRPERQKLGLAAALVLEVENRVLALGVHTATVHSWSTSEGANRLYERLGYRAADRQLCWRRA